MKIGAVQDRCCAKLAKDTLQAKANISSVSNNHPPGKREQHLQPQVAKDTLQAKAHISSASNNQLS